MKVNMTSTPLPMTPDSSTPLTMETPISVILDSRLEEGLNTASSGFIQQSIANTTSSPSFFYPLMKYIEPTFTFEEQKFVDYICKVRAESFYCVEPSIEMIENWIYVLLGTSTDISGDSLVEMNRHLTSALKNFMCNILAKFEISIPGICHLIKENLNSAINLNTAAFFYGTTSITFYGQMEECGMLNPVMDNYMVQNKLTHTIPKAKSDSFTQAPWSLSMEKDLIQAFGQLIGNDKSLMACFTLYSMICNNNPSELSSEDYNKILQIIQKIRTLLNRYCKSKWGIKKSALMLNNIYNLMEKVKACSFKI